MSRFTESFGLISAGVHGRCEACDTHRAIPSFYPSRQRGPHLPSPEVARVTYTGGYVLPGTTPTPGQTPLPADLESAAVEQVAAWFLHRDKVGLELSWPKDGIYQKYTQLPLLPSIQSVLSRYQRFTI